MAAPMTVNDLIDACRSLIDEENIEAVNDSRDILPALNRAQDRAAGIFARYYEDPLLTETSLTLTGGTKEYDVPEDAFEDRIEKIEININSTSYRECTRISYRDATKYKDNQNDPTPAYYYIRGRKIVFTSPPSGSYNATIFYLQEPEKLVTQQGRITTIDTSNNYVRVDGVGSDLSSTVDSLASYVNIIDAQTGEIKVSLQIQSISGTKITFKSSPSRSSVQNRTIASAIASTVEKDDYVCLSSGTCVPYFKKPAYNFYVQYTVNELLRKAGTATSMDKQIVRELEEILQGSWSGREQQLRVKKSSKFWRDGHQRRILITDS